MVGLLRMVPAGDAGVCSVITGFVITESRPHQQARHTRAPVMNAAVPSVASCSSRGAIGCEPDTSTGQQAATQPSQYGRHVQSRWLVYTDEMHIVHHARSVTCARGESRAQQLLVVCTSGSVTTQMLPVCTHRAVQASFPDGRDHRALQASILCLFICKHLVPEQVGCL